MENTIWIKETDLENVSPWYTLLFFFHFGILPNTIQGKRESPPIPGDHTQAWKW